MSKKTKWLIIYNIKYHMEYIKNLSWHSWCEITLYKDNDRFFVRKTAGKESYNDRLKIQFEKQWNFKSKYFFAPEIYWKWYIWDILYYDMQYLNCQTMANTIKTITVKEAIKLVDLAIETLDIKWENYLDNSNEIFQNKIKSLRNSFVNITNTEDNALKKLENFNFSVIPHSQCHWDLTLENILITQDKKIYLIDFLDSFFDSRMIDVAKLLQDLEIWRSYRYEQMTSTLNLRLSIGKQALIEAILELPDWKNKVRYIYYILLLNILRIVPYTKDDITKNFLQVSLNHVMDILDNNKF